MREWTPIDEQAEREGIAETLYRATWLRHRWEGGQREIGESRCARDRRSRVNVDAMLNSLWWDRRVEGRIQRS